MTADWIPTITVVAVTVVVLCTALLLQEWLRHRTAIKKRLAELAGNDDDERSVSLFKDLRQLQQPGMFQRETWTEWLRRQMDQAGITAPLQSFAWSCAAMAGCAAIIGGLKNWWLAVVLAPLGGLVPLAILLLRSHHRQRKLCRQLPEAFEMISRAVKAGQTVPAALQIIAEDFEQPISTEFAQCYEQQNLGMSRELSLRKLAERSGIMELQIFVVALLVQAKSGGDLVQLLDNLALLIRKRLKLRERVRALTGEGRMQAMVLIVLPLVALASIAYLSPEYASALFQRPWLLAITASAQTLGALWIRKIINFEY
ncbi:type II secretion system F family protein [Aeoliella sp. ICT_H6.2]|uniref:Type II secretion system F family protein n=1 Tax=Aeoliella straminimaris TaxID=2954799 RepID=A0A9X2F7A7_9BACT|nr:type II secretion system F family protein [Aeoliella straminimaris]MCO6043667.1 type II secretion system F family protein [Aeoliella straminimaris]